MKVSVTSAFIPVEGKFEFRVVTKEEAKKISKENELVGVYTGHQTVKVLGLTPAEGRPVYTPEPTHIQLWIKPHGRLEFGREYSLEEIETIGYDIWVAIPC